MINSKTDGFVTLVITIVILLIVTALTVMTSKVLVTEQQASINQIRYREAMAAAESGLEVANAMLNTSHAERTEVGHPVSSAGAPYYSVSITDAVTSAGAPLLIPSGDTTVRPIQITSTGASGAAVGSEGAEAEVTLRQLVVVDSVLASSPDAPLVVAAGMAAGGNFTVGANPNGGGPGVPLSIWSGDPVSVGSSSQTCGLQEYDNGTCSASPYSSNGNIGSDIVVGVSPNSFPENLIRYIFGKETAEEVKNLPKTQIITNCNQLNASSEGTYFITGDCTISSDVGHKTGSGNNLDINTVILFVDNGNFRLNANNNFYGLVFAHDTDPASSPDYDITINGTATLHGAMVADYELGKSNGTYNAVYDADVMSDLENDDAFMNIFKVPGSWRDW